MGLSIDPTHDFLGVVEVRTLVMVAFGPYAVSRSTSSSVHRVITGGRPPLTTPSVPKVIYKLMQAHLDGHVDA